MMQTVRNNFRSTFHSRKAELSPQGINLILTCSIGENYYFRELHLSFHLMIIKTISRDL